MHRIESTSFPAAGSAERWGPPWGTRPQDWVRSEEQRLPAYEETIRRVGLAPGRRVLDVGCGTGVFLRLAADRGAEPSGIDASEGLLDLARRRVPAADVRLGDMQFLPFEDDCSDLVTGFTSSASRRTWSPPCVRRAGSRGRVRRS